MKPISKVSKHFSILASEVEREGKKFLYVLMVGKTYHIPTIVEHIPSGFLKDQRKKELAVDQLVDREENIINKEIEYAKATLAPPSISPLYER